MAAAVLSTACQNNNDDPTGQVFEVLINGNLWAPITATVTITTTASPITQINATSAEGETFTLQFPGGEGTTGTFNFNPGNQVNLIFNSLDAGTFTGNLGNGSITVSNFQEGVLSGSFSGTITNNANQQWLLESGTFANLEY